MHLDIYIMLQFKNKNIHIQKLLFFNDSFENWYLGSLGHGQTVLYLMILHYMYVIYPKEIFNKKLIQNNQTVQLVCH